VMPIVRRTVGRPLSAQAKMPGRTFEKFEAMITPISGTNGRPKSGISESDALVRRPCTA
jgi:hypothetical protein